MTERPQATAQRHVENGRTAVTEWRLVPGAETGAHVHGHDYVIVPVTPGRMRLELPDGSVAHAELAPGRSYFRAAGVSHNVINDGDADLVFVEIEFLEPAPAP
ncbi:cupin domain-containing protein [Azospirillum sp. ST 5-10]|uniref:cupin domain-containing protein n=1 Tax=unclassified Azospirillum TaxID=2630922 RepID=UPI003F4A732C